jgi:gluconolactonase
MLRGGQGGDGSAVDSEGRIYVATGASADVFAPTGEFLGSIPGPRGLHGVAFAGRDKKTLYFVGSGALDADGKEFTTPQGVRNNAKTIYKLPMLAEGFKGRAK